MIRFKQKNIALIAPNKSVNYVWQQFDPTGPDADATAFLTATGITDPTIITAVRTLVTDLKNYGVWTKLKAIYPFVGGTATTHKFNLKNPADTNAAFRLAFAGGWTHSANGIFGNGTNTFANTFYVPNTECDSENNSIAVYERTNIAEQTFAIGASNGANGLPNPFALLPRYLSNNAYYANGAYTPIGSGITDGRGFWLGFTDSSLERYYRNTSLISSAALLVKTISTQPLYIGANNSGGAAQFIGNRQLAFASMGGSKLTTTEASNYYTAVQAFQTTLGRQV
jgi:hypothetical protein